MCNPLNHPSLKPHTNAPTLLHTTNSSHSANCPVGLKTGIDYGATCVKINTACTSKCLGYVKCSKAACPDWENMACFYLGSSDNWKVCGSKLCDLNPVGSKPPAAKKSDYQEECVFGSFKWDTATSAFVSLADNVANLRVQCNKGWPGPDQCTANDCIGSCCRALGRCPTSSCIANALGTEERNCPKSARCPVRNNNATCVPLQQTACRDAGKSHCLGYVQCDPATPCPEWEGMNCFYNGVSNNWKLCSDPSCAKSPSPKPNALDVCDPILSTQLKNDERDRRSKTFCQHKNWRAGANPLTGGKGRCTAANVDDCHGNCATTGTGTCPTSSCIANALGDENLNCPRSARCPVRGKNAICEPYVPSCRNGTKVLPHCLGRVKCDPATPCPDFEGMDCFYNGVSPNWKVRGAAVASPW